MRGKEVNRVCNAQPESITFCRIISFQGFQGNDDTGTNKKKQLQLQAFIGCRICFVCSRPTGTSQELGSCIGVHQST